MHRRYVAWILIVTYFLLQGWFCHIIFKYPYIGVDLAVNQQNEWVVSEIYNDEKNIISNMQKGDIVKKIDGEAPENHFTVKWWNSIEQAQTIDLARNGQMLHIDVSENSGNEYKFVLGDFDYLAIFGSLLSLMLAMLLFYRAKQIPSARLLSFVFLTMGAISMSLGGSLRGDILGKFIIGGMMGLLPVVFLHFLVVFFREKGNIVLSPIWMRLVQAGYIVCLLLFVGNLSYYMPALASQVRSLSNLAALFVFLLGILTNLSLLTHLYLKFRRETTYQRTLIRTVWYSFFISFAPFSFLYIVPLLLGSYLTISNPYILAWFIYLLPLSFAYLILSRQLYDIDVILRRMLLSLFLAFFPTLVIVSFGTAVNIDHTGYKQAFARFAFIWLIITFTLYSLEYYATILQKFMFPRKYFLQKSLKTIAKKLRSITNFAELKDIILTDIVSTLEVFGGAVVFKYQEEIEVIAEGQIDIDEVHRIVEAGLIEHHKYTVFEITRHEEYTCFLIITEKVTRTFPSSEDKQWLNIIISYLAVSLENVYLMRKLTMKLYQLAASIPNEAGGETFVWFRKAMFDMQERERTRIANDLHDTTMQDIIFIKRRLEPLLEQFEQNSPVYKQIEGVLSHLEMVNDNLRHSLFELHPYLLQRIGLIDSIRKIIELEEGLNEFEIDFTALNKDDVEQLTLEAKTHIFRIVQELINNAKKYSHASQLSIVIGADGKELFIRYIDDGVGFDTKVLEENENRTTVAKSGMGMSQMKGRVLHLEGKLDIESKTGQGVRLNIRIPKKKGMIA